MSDEMIGRIAKAIKDCGAYTPDWQGADEDLIIMARAAIAAMREYLAMREMDGTATLAELSEHDAIDAALNSKS